MKNVSKYISVALMISIIIMTFGSTVSMAAELKVELGIVDDFAVVAGSTITNTGTTTINGNIGLHPGTDFDGQASVIITGDVHLTDGVASQAKSDLLAAYNDAAGRALNTTGSELGNRLLIPGVYTSASSFQITGTLTLDGQNDPDAVFIFQMGSTLTTASGSNIELINGANFNNVYWQVGSSATLGTNSEFSGNILADESITAATGARIDGRLLAIGGAVTLDNNVITSLATGALTVVKTVSGNIDNLTLPPFEISISGPDNFTATKVFVNNESFTWVDLLPGTYTVTENRAGLSGEWTVSGEGATQVWASQTQLVTINNLYTQAVVVTPPLETTPLETTPIESTPELTVYGALTVTKLVAGDTTDLILPSFEITVTGPNGFSQTRNFLTSESYTWNNLVPGVYIVSENGTDLSSAWRAGGEGPITVIGNQIATSTIVNTYEQAESVEVAPVETTEVPTTTETAEPTEPNVPLAPVIPQTGQDSDYLGFVGLAALFAALGFFLEKGKNKMNG